MYTAEQTARLILKSYFALLNRTYDVRGNLPLPAGPKIIAMNHTPGCDPFYLPFLLDEVPHFLLQEGMFTIPLVGSLLKETGQIPVYRGTERARDAKELACSLLREGKTIAIFPEGKDVPLGQRIPAKSGTVRMSIESGAPIIPVGLFVPPQFRTPLHFHWQGSAREGAWQFTGRSFMRFGAPWKPSPQGNVHVQTEELMDRIYSLVAEAERDSQCVSLTSLNPILR